jgi:type I restriction-modification system DNA methylase subunit
VSDHAKDFDKLLGKLAYRHERWRVFSDFVALAAISLTNRIHKAPKKEERYLQIMKTYSKDETEGLAELLAIATHGMGGDPDGVDFLGEAFQRNELASHWHGQFFTPMPIARMMAEMTLADGEAARIAATRGFITAQEPACGSGVMAIALANALRASGIEPQRKLHVTAIDISPTAAHMAVVQLSLLGIPAVVHVGNTITLEMSDAFATPWHVLGFWDTKLKSVLETSEPRALASREQLSFW